MTKELDLLKLVCQSLDTANISYMLTGSFATNFYAIPRMTRDMDIVVKILESDVERLVRIFQEKDFYLSKDSILEAVRSKTMFNMIHNDSVFKIDFIVCKDSAYSQVEFQRKRKILLDDMWIWIVSPEDLVIAKLLWAKDSLSERQLRDVENLLSSHNNLDEKYIDMWIQTLGLDFVYRKVKKSE